MKAICSLLVACGLALAVRGSEAFDQRMDELSAALTFAPPGSPWRARLSGTLDLEARFFDDPPPSLIDADSNAVFQPRATLFLDAQAGPTLYAFVQARLDRGFDPSDGGLRARLDEAFVRYTPWTDGRFNLQAGAFATVAGQWVKRHLSWQNPFVTAPLFYENVTRASDLPLDYRSFPSYPGHDRLYNYNPAVWGPSYAPGAAVSGRWRQLEWTAEIKNSALASRPEFWGLADADFGQPTCTGRVGWRLDARWNVGLSASQGGYLGPAARDALPAGEDADRFKQTTYLADASFEWRRLQIWAEALQSEFVVPYSGDVKTTAYFIEAKKKLSPRLSAALRLNRQTFSQVRRQGYDVGPWGDDQSRLDLAATWRLDAHAQIQVEANLRRLDDAREDPSPSLSTRLTLRF